MAGALVETCDDLEARGHERLSVLVSLRYFPILSVTRPGAASWQPPDTEKLKVMIAIAPALNS